MRGWLLTLWMIGLAGAGAASWFLLRHPEFYPQIANPDLRILVPLLPVFCWAVLPILFWRLLPRRPSSMDSPGFRDERRRLTAFLADRGLTGRRRLYSVPFFLVVGPPGSGKSSLLERAELNLGLPKVIAEANWWVGPQAVFVEVQTTQDADALMRMLISLRPKLPVNAVLLVASPADLVLADQIEQRQVAQSVATWLREAEEALRHPLPVYLFLSRIDLVPGFHEIFERTEPVERAQPWGFALSYPGAGSVQSVEQRYEDIKRGFGDIVESIKRRQIELLSRETDPVRCAHIHGFAAQIAAMQRIMAPIFEAIMPVENGLWKGGLLRGIFMTSAHQELLSIDALLPELSRRFAMPRSGMLPPDLGIDDERDHGYFVAGAIKKAVLPEAGLVMGARGRLGNLFFWSPAILSALFCLFAGHLVLSTFDRELQFEAGIVDMVSSVGSPLESPARRQDLKTVMERLDRLDALAESVRARPPMPIQGMALNNRRHLLDSIEEARQQYRINALAPLLSAWIEADLVDDRFDSESLQRLIGIANAAGDPDSADLRAWLEARASAMTPGHEERLVTEALAAIRGAGGLAVEANYVEAAHRRIRYRESLT